MKWIERWYVDSHSSDKIYTVSRADDGETMGCSCPHWTRNVPRPTCKHIREVLENGENQNITYDEFFTEEEFKI